MKKQNSIFNNPIVKMITKVLSWVLLVLLSLIALLLIYNVASSKIYEIRGEKYEPSISLYTIISPSMEPNINVYDVVITKKVTDFSQLKEGDVITFVSTSSLGEGLTITHRIKSVIKTDDDYKFRTQGDNNPIPDSSLVNSKNVLGKVIFRIPYLGHVQFLLQSKGGWFFALLIPAIIVVVYDIVRLLRLKRVKKKVEESYDDVVVNEEAKEKQENLKKILQIKHVKDEKSINNEQKVNVVDEAKLIDVDQVKENIDNYEKIHQNRLDMTKIIRNINSLNTDDSDDLELPKKK